MNKTVKNTDTGRHIAEGANRADNESRATLKTAPATQHNPERFVITRLFWNSEAKRWM